MKFKVKEKECKFWNHEKLDVRAKSTLRYPVILGFKGYRVKFMRGWMQG